MYTVMHNASYWLLGRGKLLGLVTLVFCPIMLFHGWGLTFLISAEGPPARGLEMVPLLAYTILALASHSSMKWVENQSSRKLVIYELVSLALRTGYIYFLTLILGLAFHVLPATHIPFGAVSGLDQIEFPEGYFWRSALAISIIALASELIGTLSTHKLLPIIMFAVYLATLTIQPLSNLLFAQAWDRNPYELIALFSATLFALVIALWHRHRYRKLIFLRGS